MAKRDLPEPELLRKLLQYDPETGKLFWRQRPLEMFPCEQAGNTWNSKHAGIEAFITPDSKGYMTGKIFDRRYKAHRVIWVMVNDEWPRNQIDHINGNRTDNRIANLRHVTSQENARNSKRSKRNTTGVSGVSYRPLAKVYVAQIRVNKKSLYLGAYSDLDDARKARKMAERKYGFHPNHGRFS